MDRLWRDFSFGARSLLHSPGFAIVAVVTLALGIGANTATFSLVSASLLQPLPWPDPDSLVSIREYDVRVDAEPRGVSTARYHEWSELVRSFEGLVAVLPSGFTLRDGEESATVSGARVLPDGWRTLRIPVSRGRGFTAADAAAGAPPVAMISHGLWQRRYGEDPEIVGRAIRVDGDPVTVVGVLDSDQWFPYPGSDLLLTLRLETGSLSWTDHALDVGGRLRPGVSLAQAQSEMDVIMARLRTHHPETGAWTARVELTRDLVIRQQSQVGITLMMAASGLVLLIACANVATLLLARGADRRTELAVRAALGASSGRLAGQLLAECVLLAVIALPVAVLFARWGIDGLLSSVPDSITFMDQFFRIDRTVLAFAAAASLATVLVFGLMPAIHAARRDPSIVLKEGGERGSTAGGLGRLRSALVVAQVALATALLVTAGLLIQRFGRLQENDPGFAIEDLLATRIQLPERRYPESTHWIDFQRSLLPRLEALSGVESVALVNEAPFGGAAPRQLHIQGRVLLPEDGTPEALWSNVSAGYFDTLGVKLREGRKFDARDREGSLPVAIVNETLARRHFPGASSLGEYVVVEDGEPREIVGVVSDATQVDLSIPVRPQIYEPFHQQPTASVDLVVRTRGDPLRLAGALRREIRGIDAEVAVFLVQSMEQRMSRSLWRVRFFAVIISALGGLALALAVIGVYGVVSYSVSRRTREFGIRAALGAAPADIAWAALRGGLGLAAAGVPVGLVLATGMAAALKLVLYSDLAGFDALAFASISSLLIATAGVASGVPALRAQRVDPMVALRDA